MPNETDQSGNQSLKDAIDGVAITTFSDELLRNYLDTLSELHRTRPVVDFFAFLIRYTEYNRIKYLTCKHEIIQLRQEFTTLKREIQTTINTSIHTSQTPQVRFTSTPNVAASTAPGARAVPPNLDPMESILVNADNTYSRLMGHVGNNVRVTFSNDEETSSRKAKLLGSSAKMDTFTGFDMSTFPQWVAQFLSGINLLQPTEPHACRMALALLRNRAAEMAKTVPEEVSMTDLQQLLVSLDRLFNTTGNRMVAVNLFNSYSQKEDISIQDYSLNIEQLFYRAYPGVDPNQSIFLMDKFISGLVSPQVKERLRIPPQPTTFREAVNSAMSLTAAIFPEHQILRQRSLAWKMAASSSHPLMAKSISGNRSIQMLESSPEEKSIQSIRRWCALHKTDKHSDSDCRAQQESTPPTAAKRRPTGDKKVSKPRRLRFRSTSDRKKFLRSIEEMEGVSIDDNSNDDDNDIVTQSLMQLHINSPSEPEDTDEEDQHLDLHILVLQPGDALEDEDAIMEDVNITGAQIQNDQTSPDSPALLPQERIQHIHIEGQAEVGMFDANPLPDTPDYASLSSSDAALLDGPTILEIPAPVPKIPKIEENPFSPSLLDLEMYPALPSPQEPPKPEPQVPLPHGRILLNGVYYDPVPPAHNVVVATSSIPTTPMVRPVEPTSVTPVAPSVAKETSDVSTPTAPTTQKPKVGLEFAMPEDPPFQKVERRSRKKSRSLSKARSKSRSQSRHRRLADFKNSATSQQTSTTVDVSKMRSGRGRGKKRPEMTNAPITVPTSYSHLLHIPEPKGGLTVTFSKEEQLRKVETTVQHLEKLSAEASIPLEVVSKPSEATKIEAETTPAQDDSDVDLDTGKIFVPTLPTPEAEVLVYKTDANIEDCKGFASVITSRESSIWDQEKVAIAPDLFYESYFKDFQYISDLRQKSITRIQFHNLRVTRQDSKPKEETAASSKAQREQLEAKFRTALLKMYEAFEDAATFGQPDFVLELRDQLVNPAISHMTNLFVSSRCRTCYRGRTQDPAWRRTRFRTLLPFLTSISPDAYKKAEEHQAIALLEKTSLDDDGPLPDKFKLGFSDDDIRIYRALTRSERWSYDEELKALARNNTLIRPSRRRESQKDTPPLNVDDLNHAALQRIRLLRRQNLLPIAQALLHRYRLRHERLIALFGRHKN